MELGRADAGTKKEATIALAMLYILAQSSAIYITQKRDIIPRSRTHATRLNRAKTSRLSNGNTLNMTENLMKSFGTEFSRSTS